MIILEMYHFFCAFFRTLLKDAIKGNTALEEARDVPRWLIFSVINGGSQISLHSLPVFAESSPRSWGCSLTIPSDCEILEHYAATNRLVNSKNI